MDYTINGMITSPEAISELFKDTAEVEEEKQENKEEKKTQTPPTEETEEQQVTETPTIENLFERESERVGNDNNSQEEKEEREPSEDSEGSSPNETLYSSIANSLAEEGALSFLTDDDLKEVKDTVTLVEAMKKQVAAMRDEDQKRIASALDAGMQPNAIKQYEDAIKYLDSITEDQLSEEGEEGEKLRKGIIYQYYLTLNESKERAEKMVERAITNGTDQEDAKDFLESLKDHYKKEYSGLIEDGKRKVEEAKEKQKQEIEQMKKTLLQDKTILGDIEVDAGTRQRAFDNLMRPTHKTEDGGFQSEIQKYMSEHPADFQMKVALLFTMTDGFTKMDKVLQQTVKKEKKKAMQDLERVINGTKMKNGVIAANYKDNDSSFNGLQFAPPSMWK